MTYRYIGKTGLGANPICLSTMNLANLKGKTMTTPTIHKELFLDINCIKQYVLICGTDADKPILLMVHGGNPETVYFKKYNAELEEHFLVVYWEQRGTGKSYHKTIDQ